MVVGALFAYGQAVWGQSSMPSLAAQLDAFAVVSRIDAVAGVTARSFSGVAWQHETASLYIVDNDNANIYVLNTSGQLQRTLATTGMTDLEGIVYQGDNRFLLSEEGKANIIRLELPRQGNGPVTAVGAPLLNLGPDMGNSGIEGVAYRTGDGASDGTVDRAAFAVKEISPPRLYRIELDDSGNPISTTTNIPFNIESKDGDAADLFALNDGHFIFVNQESNRLEGYNAQGQLLSILALGMSKPEGLAIDTASQTLYVVGEPAEFRVFKKPTTFISEKPGSRGGLRCLFGLGRQAGLQPNVLGQWFYVMPTLHVP
jgi:uncharacterized protein YjiK